MEDGKDSFPVFYVTPASTLAHTLAKLVATNSHRLWVTEPPSPSSSGPPTPLQHSATLATTSSHNSSVSSLHATPAVMSPPLSSATSPLPRSSAATAGPHSTSPTSAAPTISPSGPSISASALPGAHLSGHLVGVISLTDILNLFARASGLHTLDPNEIRKSRRASSSSTSSSVRRSGDLGLRPGPTG